jgi:hypothetical protein
MQEDEEHAAAASREEKGKSRAPAELDEEELEEDPPREEDKETGATTNATKRKKKLLMITTGTRGDVQPFLALGSPQPPTLLLVDFLSGAGMLFLVNLKKVTKHHGVVLQRSSSKRRTSGTWPSLHTDASPALSRLATFTHFHPSAGIVLGPYLGFPCNKLFGLLLCAQEHTAGTVRLYPLEGDPGAILHSDQFVKAAYEGGAHHLPPLFSLSSVGSVSGGPQV